MRQLTKKQKIKVIDEVIKSIERIIKNDWFQGLCVTTLDVFRELKYKQSQVDRFPEWTKAIWDDVDRTGGGAYMSAKDGNIRDMKYRLRFAKRFRKNMEQ